MDYETIGLLASLEGWLDLTFYKTQVFEKWLE